ncbi:MAG: hypothetical protein ACOZF0_16725 [Thermodesulfobacteriota bacterium]
MTKHIYDRHFHEFFEYHGNTTIEHITQKNGVTIDRDWLLFDSVEEAQDFFNDKTE